jgi:release factor glutamine methyltransferase
MKVWTTLELIEWTTGHFKTKGIESSRLDAELLLASALNCQRLDLYLKFDMPVGEEHLETYRGLVNRRAKREPIAYILGKQEFYARSFDVSSHVLIPRPETELIIEKALGWAKTSTKSELTCLDVGCGSGAIGLTLALEDSRFTICCVDVSEEACKITAKNAKKHNIENRVDILTQDFEGWSQLKLYDLIVSNPPYIGRQVAQSLTPDVREFEPEGALYGGPMGHEVIEKWIPKMTEVLAPGGLLLCEIGYDQEDQIMGIAQRIKLLERQMVARDLAGQPRLFMAQKT